MCCRWLIRNAARARHKSTLGKGPAPHRGFNGSASGVHLTQCDLNAWLVHVRRARPEVDRGNPGLPRLASIERLGDGGGVAGGYVSDLSSHHWYVDFDGVGVVFVVWVSPQDSGDVFGPAVGFG